MKINSPHWDLSMGVCTKHDLPVVPCPACMEGDGDEDVEFHAEEADWDFLDGQDLFAIMDATENGRVDKDGNPVYKPAAIRDLVPANFTRPRFV